MDHVIIQVDKPYRKIIKNVKSCRSARSKSIEEEKWKETRKSLTWRNCNKNKTKIWERNKIRMPENRIIYRRYKRKMETNKNWNKETFRKNYTVQEISNKEIMLVLEMSNWDGKKK